MFCTNCGTKNEDTAAFCTNCGKKLTAPEPAGALPEFDRLLRSKSDGGTEPSEPETDGTLPGFDQLLQSKSDPVQSNHPYHQLGGWLAFVTYGWLLAAILQAITLALTIFSAFSVAKYLGGWAIFLALFSGITQLITLRLCWEFFRLVREKDHRFFRYYETLTALSIILGVIDVVRSSFSSDSVSSLLGVVLLSAIWIAYFCKSVRVRTYFGTDLYLKESHFFHDVQPPEPATGDYFKNSP